MLRHLASLAIPLALVGPPAYASQVACTFSTGEAPHYYELEFIGYGDAQPIIVFSSTAVASGKRIELPPAHYSLQRFSPEARAVSLTFRNPDDPALPPSFGLHGTGGRAVLSIGSRRMTGDLACDG